MTIAIAITTVVLTLTGIKYTRAAEATDTSWSMNLLPFSVSNTDNDSWNTYNGGTAKVPLTRIVGGPSYYAYIKACNATGDGRSEYRLCLQGNGYYNLNKLTMIEGYEYQVRAYNQGFETSYRWAYGNFTW